MLNQLKKVTHSLELSKAEFTITDSCQSKPFMYRKNKMKFQATLYPKKCDHMILFIIAKSAITDRKSVFEFKLSNQLEEEENSEPRTESSSAKTSL